MIVVRHAESRRTETPNAVMTTLASPTLGGAERAVWRVDMTAGQQGPVHVMDSEQVWTVLDGAASVEVGGDDGAGGADGASHTLTVGDSMVVPGGVQRRIIAGDAGLAAVVVGAPGARASLPDGTDRGVPPWMQ